MLAWIKGIFKGKLVLDENDIVISPSLARAILLNRTVLNSELDVWGKKNFPRWADFFDPNNKNYSVPLYRTETSVWQAKEETLKILMGYLIRYSDHDVWVIRSRTRNAQPIWDTFQKLGMTW